MIGSRSNREDIDSTVIQQRHVYYIEITTPQPIDDRRSVHPDPLISRPHIELSDPYSPIGNVPVIDLLISAHPHSPAKGPLLSISPAAARPEC